ncbi:hypothetical protein O181_017504 [Austropuccinia psidii MF-1]|uniref:Uncharacterized protein n=1 Tax=Austropuccinia psidii MF-1 TaxID=1389203 RepID=A0A9Q3GSU3_9BASI|nr:hypothetical protein [Austropuccinia psidii MF-1]
MEYPVSQREGQRDKGLVEEPNSFIHRQEERVGDDPRFGEGTCSGFKKLQKRSKASPNDLRRNREVPGAISQREKSRTIGIDLTHKGI